VTSILSSISGYFSKSLILGTFLPVVIFTVLGLLLLVPHLPPDIIISSPLEGWEKEWRVIGVSFVVIVVSGLIYGVIAYFGMKYIVVPLSAIGQRGPLPRLPILLTEVIGHAVLVGLPVALLARRSAKANENDSPKLTGAEASLRERSSNSR